MKQLITKFFYIILIITVPAIFYIGVRFFIGETTKTLSVFVVCFFSIAVLLLTLIAQHYSYSQFLIPASLVTLTIYFISNATPIAWAFMVLLYATLIWIAITLTQSHSKIIKILLIGFPLVISGLVPNVINQIETRFSSEEFIVLIETSALGGLWLILFISTGVLSHLFNVSPPKKTTVSLPVAFMGFSITVLAILLIAVNTYQDSFYLENAPEYDSITRDSPFICGEIFLPDGSTYSGDDVFRQILMLVEANPNKSSPEYGMLALSTGSREWADLYHAQLLEEAREKLYTGPAHSVKFGQYEAALRVYYYPRVKAEFPHLFSNSEDQEIQEWFLDINRRSLTVELVDWMYGVAFDKKPEGPYANQEIGLGLLSLLETVSLSDKNLSRLNKDYLASNLQGWNLRFRNTDDAAMYQPIWLNNAYFQSLYDDNLSNQENKLHSFEWLLLQALPDGAPLQYNQVSPASMADTAYLYSEWFENETAMWISGKSAEYLINNNRHLYARPGLEQSVSINGLPPEFGSCLLFGDSGLPNQLGPLAPDKIVFRDGWSKDSTYMLVNLRFTGWHRYKASNTITTLYKKGELLTELTEGKSMDWLPEGRSVFRDKRIPRENLNGLVIEKSGLSAVLYEISGIGSIWAQDPQYYANVEEFRTGSSYDYSHTTIVNWHGWEHSRKIFFYHEGPIVIIDEANGPVGQNAAVVWHVQGDYINNNLIKIQSSASPAEMRLISYNNLDSQTSIDNVPGRDDYLNVFHETNSGGIIKLITIFLTEGWIGADTYVYEDGGRSFLKIENMVENKVYTLPLDE